jgi:predicted alpha-1,2-mannosidase
VRYQCELLLLLILSGAAAARAEDDLDLVRFVNPLIGTDGGSTDIKGQSTEAGNTPPGAAYPFGMALWSPDTTAEAGGYRYFQQTISGFSLTHYSGRGVSCYQDVPFLPTPGAPRLSPGTHWSTYSADFRHEAETAAAGYYRVLLATGIQVELTVTARTGFARFTFPPSRESTILINTSGSANGNQERGTTLAITTPDQVTGSVTSGNCGGNFRYTLYFAAQFDRPSASYGVWSGDAVSPGESSADGAKSGAWLTFDTTGERMVLAKVGLSFISVENARRNLTEENPCWDFDSVRDRTRALWNSRLNRIQVRGGTDDQKTIFYTALYHTLIHPSTFSDVNGEYLGFDQKVHHADGFTQYHNFASWDSYRCQTPLLAVLAPETSDMIQSLVNDAQQDSGGGLPRWLHANSNSGGMVGDSQDAVIATAYAFGARRFDISAALGAMDRGASQLGARSGGHPVREGLEDYLNLGYVSTSVEGSAAITLEYANDDFAISQFALALGDTVKHRKYMRRAQNWRNLFSNGYIVPRNADGSFIRDFYPATEVGFVESSGAQYVWMLPFNMRGLFDAMGGNQQAIERLDRHFMRINSGPDSEFAFIGNEPGLKAPWSYVFAGAPWRTQQVVRRTLLQYFFNAPGGLPGNDDGGAMSSWVVWASLGLFPHIPGVGGVVAGSPLFPSIAVRLAGGGTLQINAPAAGAAAPYVQGLTLNGAAFHSPWIPWDAIAPGGTIEFSLGEAPNPQWGSDPDEAPPSFDEPQRLPRCRQCASGRGLGRAP